MAVYEKMLQKMGILSMVEVRYSDIFHRTKLQDYYAIPQEQLDHVHYSKLASPPKYDVYPAKLVGDDRMRTEFLNSLTENQRYYGENGYLISRNLIPHDLCDAYLELRKKRGMGQNQFSDSTPYVEHPEIRRIATYKPLMDIIRELHGYEPGLIFTLTGFKSTERGWHQDAYLDRDDAIPRIATWIAIDDVDEECGPFEYIPGSHHWMALSNVKINEYLKEEYRWPNGHRARAAGVPGWGRISEAFVDPAVYAKIERDGAEVKHFTAKKGDVMFWYGRLMHRGSPPRREGATRSGLIGHYSPIFERERGVFREDGNGSRYILPPDKVESWTAV
ncbi:phytanoyl-CoA dioxygenase family protein [Halovulum sp. GXIMD14793]